MSPFKRKGTQLVGEQINVNISDINQISDVKLSNYVDKFLMKTGFGQETKIGYTSLEVRTSLALMLLVDVLANDALSPNVRAQIERMCSFVSATGTNAEVLPSVNLFSEDGLRQIRLVAESNKSQTIKSLTDAGFHPERQADPRTKRTGKGVASATSIPTL